MMDEEKAGSLTKMLLPPGPSDSQVYESIRAALAEARSSVAAAVNSAMVGVYWEIGRQIAEAVGDRAEYGKRLLRFLSERLTSEFGKGFTVSNLRNMRQFYQTFPIRHALRSELGWTHYRLLMRVEEPSRRDFYLAQGADSGWTSRQLERQINSFYYECLLATRKEHRREIRIAAVRWAPRFGGKLLGEITGKESAKYDEGDLEQALIDKLQEFLLELGKGFSFVARQKRITTEHGEHINKKAIREIAGHKPRRAAFCDGSFASSPEKINVFKIFKPRGKNTSVKAI